MKILLRRSRKNPDTWILSQDETRIKTGPYKQLEREAINMRLNADRMGIKSLLTVDDSLPTPAQRKKRKATRNKKPAAKA